MDEEKEQTLVLKLSDDTKKFFTGFHKVEIRLNEQSVTIAGKDLFNILLDLAVKNIAS